MSATLTVLVQRQPGADRRQLEGKYATQTSTAGAGEGRAPLAGSSSTSTQCALTATQAGDNITPTFLS